MKKEYKGYSIEFDEKGDCFVAYKNGEQFAINISMAKLKEQIDMLTKKAFQRLPIYYNYSPEKIQEGEITSFNSVEKGVWISYGKEKQREKKGLRWDGNNLIHKTKENLAILQEIQKIVLEKERLEKKEEKLTEKLTYYTYSELCKISGQTELDG
uniref:Uncharacterized protein n=3 Tax=viral metagenome TaxID=1070528 RepID=A0A6H1ZWG4_9ZZZZ